MEHTHEFYTRFGYVLGQVIVQVHYKEHQSNWVGIGNVNGLDVIVYVNEAQGTRYLESVV